VEVDGQKTPDLDTFLEVVKGLAAKPGGADAFVRIKMIGLEGKPKVRRAKRKGGVFFSYRSGGKKKKK
jgi:hypothetical protein